MRARKDLERFRVVESIKEKSKEEGRMDFAMKAQENPEAGSSRRAGKAQKSKEGRGTEGKTPKKSTASGPMKNKKIVMAKMSDALGESKHWKKRMLEGGTRP